MTTHQTSVCCLNVLCYVPARQPKIKRWVAKAGRPAAGQPVARGWRETLGPARPPHCETRSHQPGKKVSGGLQVAGPGRGRGPGAGGGPGRGATRPGTKFNWFARLQLLCWKLSLQSMELSAPYFCVACVFHAWYIGLPFLFISLHYPLVYCSFPWFPWNSFFMDTDYFYWDFASIKWLLCLIGNKTNHMTALPPGSLLDPGSCFLLWH